MKQNNSDFILFRKQLLKSSSKRTIRVTNSYGIEDAWKWLKKKYPDLARKVGEKPFKQIIRGVNNYLVSQLLLGKDISLPLYMGKIGLRKYSRKFKEVDGKVKVNSPINWKETLELWYSDSEAYKNKTFVKYESRDFFTIVYNKNAAKFKNKVFYSFTPTRAIKKKICEKVKENSLDAFLFGK